MDEKTPTIKQRLEYIKICDIVINLYDKEIKQGYNKFLDETESLDRQTLKKEKTNYQRKKQNYKLEIEKFSDLKTLIIKDIMKDPNFLNYVNKILEENKVNKTLIRK